MMARILVTLFLFLAFTGQANCATYDPKANVNATELVPSEDHSGCARFTVLTPSLIRIEYTRQRRSGSWIFLDNATEFAINRNLTVPSFNSTFSNGIFVLSTKVLQLFYDFTGAGTFSPSTLSVTVHSTGAKWHFGADPMTDGGSLLGSIRTLDWVMHGLNQKPARVSYPQWLNCTFMNTNQTFNHDQCMPPGPNCTNDCTYGVVSRRGWSVLEDNTATMQIGGTGYPTKDYWPSGVPSPCIHDLYFFGHGHHYRQALADMIAVGGRIPLVPRYSLGVLASGWHRWTSADIRARVANYSSSHMPIDAFVLDMDWHLHPMWGSYTWDPVLMPDHLDLIDWLHEHGLSVGVNTHDNSGVADTEAQFQAMCGALGINPNSTSNLGFHLSNRTWALAFMDIVVQAIGVDFLWPDYQFPNQEPDPHAPSTASWINHLFSTRFRRLGSTQRTFVLSRYAGLGGHRYPFQFVGDEFTAGAVVSEEYIRRRTRLAVHSTNAGVAYWSADVTWYCLRSIQAAIYSSMVRFHGYYRGTDPYNLAQPTLRAAATRLLHTRQKLIPYLYGLVKEAHDTGLGLMRGMHFDWPDEDGSYESESNLQYMLGPSVLVATIPTIMLDALTSCNWTVWLPPGRWIAFDTLREYEAGDGGRRLTARYVGDEYPVFVRADAILVTLPPPVTKLDLVGRAGRQYDRLVINVVAPSLRAGTTGVYRLYEDDGATQVLEGAQPHTWSIASYNVSTPVVQDEMGADIVSLRLSVVTMGYFPELPRTRQWHASVTLVPPPVSVWADGRSLPWCLNGSSAVDLPSESVFPILTTLDSPLRVSPREDCWYYAGQTASVEVSLRPRDTNELVNVRIDFDLSTTTDTSGVRPALLSGVLGVTRRSVLGHDALALKIRRNSLVESAINVGMQLPSTLSRAARSGNMSAFAAALEHTRVAMEIAHEASIRTYGRLDFLTDVTESILGQN